MMLEPEEIQEFQQIIEDEHGVKLSEDEATVMAQRLLSLYELIHEPLPHEQTTPPASAQASPQHPDSAALETAPGPSETSDPVLPKKF